MLQSPLSEDNHLTKVGGGREGGKTLQITLFSYRVRQAQWHTIDDWLNVIL